MPENNLAAMRIFAGSRNIIMAAVARPVTAARPATTGPARATELLVTSVLLMSVLLVRAVRLVLLASPATTLLLFTAACFALTAVRRVASTRPAKGVATRIAVAAAALK